MNYRNCIVAVIFLTISFPGKYWDVITIALLCRCVVYCSFFEFLKILDFCREINRKYKIWMIGVLRRRCRRKESFKHSAEKGRDFVFKKRILSFQNLFVWYPKMKPVYFYMFLCLYAIMHFCASGSFYA